MGTEKSPFDYQKPTEANIPVIEATREAFKVLHAHLMTLPAGRERSTWGCLLRCKILTVTAK